MPQAAEYRVWYSASATGFLSGLSSRDQWRLWMQANEIARHPFLRRGYRLIDGDGHEVEHLVVGSWILTYWIDHAQRAVMLVEIETAASHSLLGPLIHRQAAQRQESPRALRLGASA